MEQQSPEQNERNSLKILLLATEQYLKSLDELGRNFVAPQAQAAAEILTNLLNDRWGAVETEQDAPTTEAPAAKKMKTTTK